VIQTETGFTPEDIDRARRYHRPLYASWGASFLIDLVVLAVVTFALPSWSTSGLAWPVRAAVITVLTLAILTVAGLPLSYAMGYAREHRWGFSTQTVGGWIADKVKGFAVGAILTALLMTGFVALARTFPRTWPFLAAAGFAAVTLLLSFVSPVVFEPLFNKFQPLANAELAARLKALAVEAGVPVRDILVADASRRTRKENAYVSGLGRTRRVVVYDTLLARDADDELALIVAHELGHRRMRHVLIGTILALATGSIGIGLLWLLLRSGPLLRVAGANGPGDPRVIPLVMLAAFVMQLAASPFEAALSRRWETAADRFSLGPGGDLAVFEAAHVALARSNLGDLDPPRWLYLLTFSHPTAPERIANARRWASVTSGA
jgi:STE24 endopeptidase